MVHNQTFNKFYHQLNPAQRQAVDQIEGPVMVIAGPGTGKTQVLTLRIANILLKTQINPENILALTFTETGVAAMRQRLTEIIGPTAYRVNIFTYHSFANYIIQSHPEIFNHLIGAEPITELEQIQILESIFTQKSFKFIKPFGDPYFYLKAALSAISELKKENINPEKFSQTIIQARQDFDQIDDLYYETGRYQGKMRGKYTQQLKDINKNTELAEVYRLYQDQLHRQKFYDFDDMLIELIRQLESSQDFLLQLQEQYQYILVDEHQDTNRAQNKVVELLASFHDHPNLFVVGDEKQAIYRFQGASLTNFLYLKTLYPDTEVISLTQNYRSTQTILNAAFNLIQHSQLPDLDLPLRHQLLSTSSAKPQLLQLAKLIDCHRHYHFIAHNIKAQLDAGISPSQIAVLARTNQDLKDLMPALSNLNIPYVLLAKQNLLEDLTISKFITLLKAVADLDENLVFRCLYLDIFGIHPLDILRLRQLSRRLQLSTLDTLATLNSSDQKFQDLQSLTHFYQQLISWNKLSHNQPLDIVFTLILNQSGILNLALNQVNLTGALAKLTSLYAQVRTKLDKDPQFSLTDFLTFIDLLEKHQLTITADSTTVTNQAVQLMTAHGSKGLEFEHVYIINTHDTKWGNQWSSGPKFNLPYESLQISLEPLTTTDKNADERRLFYVALTRAKNQVTLCYSSARFDGKAQSPSQFLSEINADYIQSLDVTNFESWFQSHPEAVFATNRISADLEAIKSTLQPEVAALFNRYGLSATALNNYLQCPWRYFFRNLVHLPEAKTKPLIFGSVIHQTIHHYLASLSKQKLSETALIKYAHNYLQSQPLSQTEYDEIKQKLTDILSFYYHQKMTNWQPEYLSELNIEGVGLDSDIKLTGKLDLLIPTDKPYHFQIVDFKTGKPKTRNDILGKTKNSTGDYFRQLVFYQLLLERYRGGKFIMDTGSIEFVQPKDNGQIVSETFTIDTKDAQELVSTIRHIADEIRNLKFWDSRCDDSDCEYCHLRDMMSTSLIDTN